MYSRRALLAILVVITVLLATRGELSGESANPAQFLLEGRVYEGRIRDERHPLSGVMVSLYGANNPYPDQGELISSTTTDNEGWYGLEAPIGYEFYHIVETDAVEFTSVGATSVDGTVRTENWIEYVVPLEGKTLTGNKFWDEAPMLSGRVYEGEVGDESTPLTDVEVSLYCSLNAGFLGDFVASTSTNSEGWYGLDIAGVCEYYNIVETDPAGYTSEGATTVDGAVIDDNWIQYDYPLQGKTLTGNKFWDDLPPALPDLVITAVWSEDSTICYEITNEGQGLAPAGHSTMLLIDEATQQEHLVTVALAAEESWQGCFDYAWSCTEPQDSVAVWADYNEEVAESDDANNGREEVWACAAVPLEIIDGPVAAEVTRETAVITWETNKDSNSLVQYGRTARAYDSQEADAGLVSAHAVTLSGLVPATTYRFVVHSADLEEGSVQSREMFFETLPPPDEIDPVLTLLDPGELRGEVTVTAEASDNSDVEKVEFYLNESLIFTDYTSPYQLPLDTKEYDNGRYTLSATAYDLGGRMIQDEIDVDILNLIDATAPTVSITTPGSGAAVSGKVTVSATASDDASLLIAQFYVDGVYTGFSPFAGQPTSATAQFEWDTTTVSDGSHLLGVQVFDTDNKSALDTVSVSVGNAPPPTQPKLIVTSHQATRQQNGFTIALTVKNVGNGGAKNVSVQDFLRAFQPISRSTTVPNLADYEASLTASTMVADCYITDYLDLPAGQSRTYTYAAVPVLIHPNPPTPSIGDSVKIWYEGPGNTQYSHTFKLAISHTTTNVPLATAYNNALKQADYLIATNPQRLFWFNAMMSSEVDALLSEMAQLAVYENGVLGYMTVFDRNAFRNLIRPTGTWAKKLTPSFSKKLGIGGYVLIVGETEIFPAWNLSGFKKGFVSVVRDSDHAYSDTYAGWPPDISVGRIIGNDADDLLTAVETSTGVYAGATGYGFDRSHALVISGTGDGQSEFVNNANDVAKILQNDGFSVNTLHWKDYSTNAQRLQQFRNRVPNRDVLYFRDHGNSDCWCPALWTASFPVNFGSTNPFAFAAACTTGNYEEGDDVGIAETFLNNGASVYIGSTEVSPRSLNNEAGKNFFNNWDAYKTIGWAFTLSERIITTSSDKEEWWRYWVAEYNLYGDPKFGVAPPSPLLQAVRPTAESLQSLSTLDVEIPDYVVNTVEGIDYVEIPGGLLLLEEGQPQVPYYTVTIDYAAGQEVQDVTLTARSGLVTSSGLHILPASMAIDIPASIRATAVNEGWFPQADYHWKGLQNLDGSTTLFITIYPFYYNAATTGVEFYNNYSFDIDYAVSNVAITNLTTNADVYQQGDAVAVGIELENSGAAQDVVVSAVVKRYGAGEVVDGLLLATLADLEGKASFSPQWSSDGFAPGYYQVETTLQESGGTVLDKQTVLFKVGIAAGEITSFTVTPAVFDEGDSIDMALLFKNTGTVVISGTAVIDIQNENGATVQAFWHDVAALAPTQSVRFEDTWDTTGTAAGPHHLVAYVQYDGMTTDPATAVLNSKVRVYLPFLHRN